MVPKTQKMDRVEHGNRMGGWRLCYFGFHSLPAPVYPQLPPGCIQLPIIAGVLSSFG